MRQAIWIFAFIVLTGCGYAPASQYAKMVVGESVSTEMVISMEDPENTVIIKDAVDLAVITKFRTSLVAKGKAATHLKIAISSVGFIPLRYDTNGYVITYRATVRLHIDRITGQQSGAYNTFGSYDFEIAPNSIISDQARFDAISQGAQKALDSFIAQIAAQGANSSKG
jgi:Lipopolysaccharide-assembly